LQNIYQNLITREMSDRNNINKALKIAFNNNDTYLENVFIEADGFRREKITMHKSRQKYVTII
jgi:hypothetical protein